jgi:hypothetical protein
LKKFATKISTYLTCALAALMLVSTSLPALADADGISDPQPELRPATPQTGGVTFTPQIDGMVMVPLIVTYVGATAPGENQYISYIDQPVVAKTMEPIALGKNTVLPSGTVFTGQVVQIVPPRRLGRNGFAIIHFESIISAKGEVIPVNSGGTPKRDWKNEVVEESHRVAISAVTGALVGGVVGSGFAAALIIMNPGTAVASYIVGVGGGAIVGAAAGAVYGLTLKGEGATTTMAREINIAVPAAALHRASQPLVMLEELEAPVTFKSIKIRGFTNPYRLQIEAVVNNASDFALESTDLVMVNPRGDHFPMYFDSNVGAATNFSIPPHSVRHFFASFEPEMPEAGQRLVWYKHLTSLKEPLVDFTLP